MIKKDYRSTNYCKILNKVLEKKLELKMLILQEHPKAKSIYNQIKSKNSNYNLEFKKIYNYKCGYCGVSQKIISSELFEIDHYICESSFGSDKTIAEKIDNLILACKKCNRNKSNFSFPNKYKKIFNPDDGSMAKLFYRDERYYIKINREFEKDDIIVSFYEQIKFNEQTRRLDYLLMNMHGLYEKIKNSEKGEKLLQYILILQQKRNNL